MTRRTHSSASQQQAQLSHKLRYSLLVAAIAAPSALAYMAISTSSNNVNSPRAVSILPAHDGSDSTRPPRELASSLQLVGIAPESLAAAGVQPALLTTILNDARVYYTEHGTSLANTLDEYRSAKAAARILERRVQSGVSSAEDRALFATAQTRESNALAARAVALESFFQAATTHVAQEQITVLRNLAANRELELPTKYLAVANEHWNQEQWLALRESLAHVRITGASGEEADPNAVALVAQADALPEVAAANTNLANRAALEAVWNGVEE